MQGKKITRILSVIALLAMIAALYFGVQNTKLKASNKALIKEAETSGIDTLKSNLFSIDSLLIDGDYPQALDLYKDLNNDSLFGEYFNMDLRIEMSQKLAELSKTRSYRKRVKTGQKFDSLEGSFQDIGSLNTSDLSLEQAQLEVKRLKAQLSNSNSSDYLEFKTSKGTKLHYVGAVKNNKANGYGIAILDTGSRYEGQWKNNLRHGQGKFYWNDGEIYEGEYSNDRREGYGTYYWDNGEKYVGEWKEDARNGKGEFYNKRGKLKASGVWENDKLVEEN